MPRWVGLFAFVSLLCHSAASVAEEPPATPIPRIGVVLGGGGARGFAHLGVLKELERLNIPIACISGTSAGALIGGIYASGVSIAEMEQSFAKADWPQRLSGKPPRSEVPYERKRDEYKNYFDFTLGVRNGELRMPRSAINSQDIDLLLHQMTRDRSAEDFDSLPIPFRAVATDLETGDPVVFAGGSLARALRASMAVPGVFDVVEEENGRLLIDGMMSRNLPVEDVKGRCADRVIVVDVSTPMLKKDKINTLFDVVNQTSNIAVNSNVRVQLARLDERDIVIRPELNGYSPSDFQRHREIAERGRQAAAALEAQLKRFAVAPEQYAAWHARLKPQNLPAVDEVQVAADTQFVNRGALVRRLVDEEGRPQSVEALQGKLAGLFAEGDYERIGYQLLRQGDKQVMVVTPLERTVGPNYLRFGLGLNGSTPGDNHFSFLASHDRTWLNPAGGSWHNDLYLGQDKSFRTELIQPLSATSPLFMAASSQWGESILPVFGPEHVRLAEIRERAIRLSADAGVRLGRYGEFRLGVFRARERASYWTGDSINDPLGLQGLSWLKVGAQARLVLDQFDNPRWPRGGYFAEGTFTDYFKSVGSNVKGRALSATGDWAGSYKDTSLRFTAKYKANLVGLNYLQSPQVLGGFLNLSGYQQEELVGEKAALLRLMAYQRVATLPSALGSGLYLGSSLELGKLWHTAWTSTNTRWLPGGSLFIGADTLLGPFFVGLGHAKGGVLTGYVFLGVDY